jgi:hypothetical protein
MTYPNFNVGETLRAADMNAVSGWLVKTQTVGAGVSSVTVNNCFNADYENYKIIYSGGQSSASVNLALQLTVGGTASTTGYYGVLVWGNLTNAVVAAAVDNNAGAFNFAGGAAGANDGAVSMDVDLLNPFQTKRSRLHHAMVLYSTVYGSYSAIHDLGNSYDGIRISVGAGTFSGGTIRVYGYRN